ncbi:YncE family protein [Nitrospiraceae bacterium AH_259_D15_M11_P09]|nr:YncE family protein [Nitrospiraceae bacterium AH_259_D15_M11_P09]
MLNYESKLDNTIRKEGIIVMDVDPNSSTFGQTLMEIPLPHDLVAHHIFYNKDATKAYVTALGQSELRIIDMTRFPYRMKTVDVPGCKVGEDLVFADDNKTWYLTCMGAQRVIVGDAITDKPTKTITLPKPYPHGIAVHDGLDRLLVTSTVRPSDLGDAGETITVIEASTGKVLSTHKVSTKASPSGAAPVEILFMPGSNPPMAYITNMFGSTLWAATWDAATKDFDVQQVFDFAPHKAEVPLEMYFNKAGDRLYITTAKPGAFHIFDISQDPGTPKRLHTLPAGEGAHHVAFTQDGRYAYVQNALLNLPGLSDGSITVIDLQNETVIGSITTLKNQGFNPNCVVLLPEWNDPAGH